MFILMPWTANVSLASDYILIVLSCGDFPNQNDFFGTFFYICFLLFKQGIQHCAFYMQNGHCKFGSTCKFDHPMEAYSPSASSLIDIPIAPYTVGSLLATVAPSSSSSELRPELISGSYPTRMPSSGNTSSSVGLIFSQTGPVSLSEVQHSSQISSPLSGGRSTRQGGEVRRSS